MPHPVKILVFAGASRHDSHNKKLACVAARLAEQAGAEVTLLDLATLPMPLYDGDCETDLGVPENGMKLKELLKSHEGFIIASPEYNSSYSALLKNCIDWASRPIPGESPLGAFTGKYAAIISASLGALGGLRRCARCSPISWLPCFPTNSRSAPPMKRSLTQETFATARNRRSWPPSANGW